MVKLVKLYTLLLLGILAFSLIEPCYGAQQQSADEDDFSDFDDEFESEGFDVVKEKSVKEEISRPVVTEAEDADAFVDTEEDEAVIETEDEFSHLEDTEEFIGYTSESTVGSSSSGKGTPNRKESLKEPKITIANVPLHLRSNWDSFYLELILLAVLIAYFSNFAVGRTKNLRLANAWFEHHKSFLLQQFALVGDDLKTLTVGENATTGQQTPVETKSVIGSSGGCAGLQKESESIYSLHCSGRVCVHSLTVELRLIKRQDLASLLFHIVKPGSDEVIFKIRLDDMDTFVMCLAAKKFASKYAQEMKDLNTYCPGDRKTSLPKQYSSNIASKFLVWSEIGEATQAILGDQKVSAVLNKHLQRLNYIHVSDQYAGPKHPDNQDQPTTQTDENGKPVTKLPEVHKMLILSFQFSQEGKNKADVEDVQTLKPLLMLTLYLADKIYKLKLTKEARLKAQRNRSKVQEAYHKATHQARAERAQEIREEKRREARERMLNSDDPEKQRKWEEKENKKAAKKRAPKMKQMKVV